MMTALKEHLVRQGIEALYAKLGTAKTLRFFQMIGVNQGNTLEEIESVTSKLSREQAIKLVKKARGS
ncbi:hypothetical protein HYU12_03420 [Candidatus Woesearchaeota archaeon]|nr:hypothetical protein [Candidatus Woesearchaeota archaeon]